MNDCSIAGGTACILTSTIGMSLHYQKQYQRLKFSGGEYPETLLEQGALHTYLPMIDYFHTNKDPA